MHIRRDQNEAVEAMVISANLNSSLLFNFLMGIYTMVYAGTVYLSVTRRGKSFQHRIVLYVITLLYMLCASLFGLYWYSANLSLVKHGDTRETAFVASVVGPRALSMGINALEGSMLIVADGLLIWRCFHVCNRSWYAVLVPILLLIVETGIGIATTFSRLRPSSDSETIKTINTLIPTGLLLSAVVTLMTSSLIAYRIYTSSKSTVDWLSPVVRFRYVIRIVFESAAVYSIVAIANAVLCAVVPSISQGSREVMLLDAGVYLESLTYIVAGMAPTILVAKVVTAKKSDVDEHASCILADFESGSQSTMMDSLSVVQFEENTELAQRARHTRARSNATV